MVIRFNVINKKSQFFPCEKIECLLTAIIIYIRNHFRIAYRFLYGIIERDS